MTEDDLDTMTEAELLARPMFNAAPANLSRLWALHSPIIHQHEVDELALELAGDSGRAFMLFPDQDPKQKRRIEERRRRAQQEYEQALRYIRDRSDRLLLQVDEQQRAIEKRRKEIEDNAIKLHDGRRVYVDGNRYDDEHGFELTGADRDDARAQHRQHPDASTWEQKQDIDIRYEETKQLQDKILKNRESGEGTPEEKQQRLAVYEQEFQDQVETRARQAPPDYGGADYMTELDGEYTISTVPA